MQFTITRHGVPLGEVELAQVEAVNTVDFRPLPAYATVSATVCAARRAMRGELFVNGGSLMAAEDAAFEQAVAAWRTVNAELELRDPEGRLVPTTAIELLDEEEGSPCWLWSATIVFAEAPVGVPAIAPPQSGDGNAEQDALNSRRDR